MNHRKGRQDVAQARRCRAKEVEEGFAAAAGAVHVVTVADEAGTAVLVLL